MFDIGFGELLLIGIVALLVLGPERLPGAARTAGAMLRKIRDSWNGVRDEVERELEAEELRKNLREAQEHIRNAGESARSSVNDGTDAVREATHVMTGKPLRRTEAVPDDDVADDATVHEPDTGRPGDHPPGERSRDER